MFALEAEALTAEAVIPAGETFSATATRPVLVAGDAPGAVVVLLEMTARGVGVATIAEPVPLIAADALHDDVAVTRAHTPSGATAVMRAGDEAWEEVGQNLPRFSWPARALRVDGGGGNRVRNPRLEGAGAPSLPTNMSVTAAAGLTTTVLSYQTIGGIPTCTIRAAGTASATRYMLSMETTTGIGASPSQAWAGSIVARQDAAPAPPVSYRLRLAPRNAAGTGIAAGVLDVTFALDGTLRRQENETAAITSNVNVTYITEEIGATLVSGQSYDFTITFGLPSPDQRAEAGECMFPPVGSPGTSSRATDVPIWTPATFPRRGCLVLRATLDAAAGASALGLLQIDDGTDDNRIVARVGAGGLLAEALVVSGGSTVATLTQAASLTAGTQFRGLVAWSPGGVRFGTSVGGLASAAIGLPPGLARALFGHCNAAGTLPMGGAGLLDFYPVWPSQADALALLAA